MRRLVVSGSPRPFPTQSVLVHDLPRNQPDRQRTDFVGCQLETRSCLALVSVEQVGYAGRTKEIRAR